MMGMEAHLPDFLNVTRDLMKKFHIINREQRYCHKVTLSQGYAINILAIRGKMTMSELSHDLGVSPSTMTRIADVLVREKVIKRTESCDDRRQVCVELTDKGHHLHQKLEHSSTEYLTLFLKALPAEKTGEVLMALQLLNKAIGDVCPG
jgi:DNA-binding MarR family transcriptional regulator